MKKEKLINVKGIIFHIALKWRIIILWMLFFAVLMDGYSAAKSYKAARNQEKTSASGLSGSVGAYASDLSKRQIKITENAAQSYLRYKELYDETGAYYENSVKMQVDALNVPTVNLLYNVSGCKDISALISAINVEVVGESFCQTVADQLDWEITPSYIAELISIESADAKDVSNDNVAAGGTELESGSEAAGRTIQIHIFSEDKESTEQIADLFEKTLEQYISDLQESLGAFSMQRISYAFRYDVDYSLLEEQHDCADEMNIMNSSMKTVSNDLTTSQQQYFSSLINGGKTIAEQKKEAVEKAPVEDAIDNSIDIINIKYIVFGLIAGAALAVIYFAVKYILSDKLHDAEEIIDYHEIPLLGILSYDAGDSRRNSKIDNLICRLFTGKRNELSYADALKMISMRITNDISKSQVTNVHMISSAETPVSDAVMNDLLKKMPENVNCTIGKSVLCDPESLDNLVQADKVILIEEMERSCSRDIDCELSICRQYEVLVMGAVVLEC